VGIVDKDVNVEKVVRDGEPLSLASRVRGGTGKGTSIHQKRAPSTEADDLIEAMPMDRRWKHDSEGVDTNSQSIEELPRGHGSTKTNENAMPMDRNWKHDSEGADTDSQSKEASQPGRGRTESKENAMPMDRNWKRDSEGADTDSESKEALQRGGGNTERSGNADSRANSVGRRGDDAEGRKTNKRNSLGDKSSTHDAGNSDQGAKSITPGDSQTAGNKDVDKDMSPGSSAVYQDKDDTVDSKSTDGSEIITPAETVDEDGAPAGAAGDGDTQAGAGIEDVTTTKPRGFAAGSSADVRDFGAASEENLDGLEGSPLSLEFKDIETGTDTDDSEPLKQPTPDGGNAGPSVPDPEAAPSPGHSRQPISETEQGNHGNDENEGRPPEEAITPIELADAEDAKNAVNGTLGIDSVLLLLPGMDSLYRGGG
jgi:hypothetical protein